VCTSVSSEWTESLSTSIIQTSFSIILLRLMRLTKTYTNQLFSQIYISHSIKVLSRVLPMARQAQVKHLQ
jgi:hypothetical protein